MTTQTDFIDQSALPASLINAVVDQMGGWENFTESASYVAQHGIDAGFSGFIYYAETIPFADKYRDEILALARAYAEDFGLDGAYSLISRFRCLDEVAADSIADAVHDDTHEDYTQIMNALAWFAAEEVCRSYADLGE